MKVLATLAIGGAAAFFGYRAFVGLKRASEKVATQISARVHKLTIQGVVLVVGFNIKNPTRASLDMAMPLITVAYNGTQLAQNSLSEVNIPAAILTSERHIRIEKYKETGMIYTEVTLPFFSLLSAGASLVKQLKDRMNGGSNPIQFEVEVNSQVFTALGSYAYDEKQTITV